MKNSFKNALNALVLFGFMVLAWATSRNLPVESIKMEVKINADSTAFILKNLEDIDFDNGNANVFRQIGTLAADSTIAFNFFKDSLNIKAKETIDLPFNIFLGKNNLGQLDTLSKKIKIVKFNYGVFFKKDNKKPVDGLFNFVF